MTGQLGLARRRTFVWWTHRSPRERILLGLLIFAMGSYVLAIGVFRPLLATRAAAISSIVWSDAALARLASAPQETEHRPMLMADESVASVLTSTATVFGLTIRRIEAEAEGVQVVIEDAEFADVIRWIATLEHDYGLRLVALEMDRRPEPGVVSARLGVVR